jgi:hypothetical protein
MASQRGNGLDAHLSLEPVDVDGTPSCDGADSFDAYCREARYSKRVFLWSKPSSVAISAALAYQNQYLTSEIPSYQPPYLNKSANIMWWWYQRLQCIRIALAPARYWSVMTTE